MDDPPYPNRVNKKGKYLSQNGYIRIRRKPGARLEMEHRVIVEEFLGRPLTVQEDVHHKNGIKTDNRLENLEVVKHGEHTLLHKPAPKPCKICGKVERNTHGQSRMALGLCSRHYQQMRKGKLNVAEGQ